jgi:hypothetical protein
MKKNKPKRPGKPRQPTNVQQSITPAIINHPRWPSRVYRFYLRTKKVTAPIAAAIGLCATAAGIYYGTIPTAKILGPDSSPFLLPFAVTNNSSFLDMNDVQFSCGPRQGQSIQVGNIIVKDVKFQDSVGKNTIATGKTVLFRCPVSNAPGNLVKGTIHPILEYRTLGIGRIYEGQDLTWFGNASPPRWVEGDIAH